MFIAFLFTDKQTGTIERQNELIARQSEMLATISSMITNQNENFLVDCLVNCSLTIDNRIDSVSYNGLEMAVTGPLTDSCDQSHRYEPGVLTIEGWDYQTENDCLYGGLLLHCIANDISNPWHNFVTDQTHWSVMAQHLALMIMDGLSEELILILRK